MADELSGRRVAVAAADGVEQVDYERPRQAVERAGARRKAFGVRVAVSRGLSLNPPIVRGLSAW